MAHPPLSAEDWDEIGAELERLIPLPQTARDCELARIKRDRPDIHSEILSLLRAHETADDFLEKPAVADSWQLLSSMVPGMVLGEYRILRLLGQGTFAQVFLALDQKLNRHVALKVSSNFGQEARTMGALEHPGIVRVFSENVDTEKNLRWISMQYVRGLSLEDLIHEIRTHVETRRSPPNGKDILGILQSRLSTQDPADGPRFDYARDRSEIADLDYEQWLLWTMSKITEALEFAHARGVLHLDVKPANILVDRLGRPMLTDFNVSLTPELAEKMAPVLGGTRRYMSPEQTRLFECYSDQGKSEYARSSLAPLDARSDAYSLGVILAELLECGNANEADDVAWLADKCQQQSPADRFTSTTHLRETSDRLFEARRLCKRMPPRGNVAKISLRFPFVVPTVFAFLPELAASSINITYNTVWIVGKLAPEQQDLFGKLVIFYNIFAYPGATLYLCLSFFPLVEVLRASPRDILSWTPEKQRQRTRQAVDFLPRIVFTTVLGWLPGILFFPGALHLLSGHLEPSKYFHFAVSFLLSWMVAATYSAVYIQYLVLRVIYPKLYVTGNDDLWNDVSRAGPRWLRNCTITGITAITPLVGALLILVIRSIEMTSERIELVRILLGVLISLGILGVCIILGLAGRLQMISELVFNVRQRR